MRNKLIVGIVVLVLMAALKMAQASYFPLSDTGSSSNLGIGTFSAFGGKLIVIGGNVGIGSLTPGTVFDVQGTTRTTGLQLNTNPSAGHVLVSDTTGIGTWMAAGTLPISGGSSQWTTTNTNDVYLPSNGNVGLGTTITTAAALSVMNGNVGIGTWVASRNLYVIGDAAIISNITNYTSTTSAFDVNGAYMSIGDKGSSKTFTSGIIGIKFYDAGVSHASLLYDSDINQFDFCYSSTSAGLDCNAGASSLTVVTTNNQGSVAVSRGSNTVHSNVNLEIFKTTSDDNFAINSGTVLGDLFIVKNAGNVGIGTTEPASLLSVAGGVGIGTGFNSNYVSTAAPTGGMIVQGNVGLGTTTPQTGFVSMGNVGLGTWTASTRLDTDGFRLSTSPAAGYVLVSGSTGIGTWMAAGTLPISGGTSGWSTGTGTVYNTTGADKVGIGTSTPQGGLVVTNGNVGIGTWAPDNPLFISLPGIGSNSYVRIFNTAGNTFSTYLGTTATNQYSWLTNLRYDGAAFVKDDATKGAWRATQVVDTTNAASRFDLQYSPVGVVTPVSILSLQGNASTGNVGIGSQAPGSLLDVLGNIRTSTLLATGNVGVGTSTAQGALVVTNGNVGVGTWAPKLDFDVNGSLGVKPAGSGYPTSLSSSLAGKAYVVHPGSNWGLVVARATNDSGAANLTFYHTRSSDASTNTTLQTGDFVGRFSFQGAVGSGTVIEGAEIGTVVNGTVDGSNLPTDIYFKTLSTGVGGGGERMRITSSGNIGIGTSTPQGGFVVTNGSVGIGTWAPASQFHVKGGSAGLRIQRTGGGFFEPFIILYNNDDASSDGGQIRGNVNETGLRFTNSSSQAEWMRINASGNIGIGTVDPKSALTVVRGVGIGTGFNSSYVSTTAPSGGMIVEGNVGIGSLSPGTALDIQGTTRTTGLQLNTNPSAGYVLVSGSTGIGTWMAAGTLPISGGSSGWSTTNTNDVYLPSSGNVGLGTSATNRSALTVMNGNVGIGTFAPAAMFQVNPLTTSPFVIDSVGNIGIGTTFTQGGAVSILTGNVGINTWTPQAWLDINAPYTGSTTPLAYIHGGCAGCARTVLLRNTNATTSSSSGITFGFGVAALTAASASIQGMYTSSSSTDLVFYTLKSGGSVYEAVRFADGGNVGIGTSVPTVQLAVMNGGTVGIGTWMSSGGAKVSIVGNIGLGTSANGEYLTTAPPLGGMIIQGNVGIGTATPQTGLAVMGNVGIGTVTAANGALIVKGGNVGIGTALAPTTLSLKGGFSQIVTTLTDAASVATDASLGNHFRLTTTQNFTLSNPTNPTDGQRVVWEIIQDGTGSRTITLDTKFQLGSDISSVTLTTTASKRDFLTAIYNVVADKWYVVGFAKGY